MCKLCLRTPVNHLSGLYPLRKGANKRGAEGHPQTPAKGAMPLWTPPADGITNEQTAPKSRGGLPKSLRMIVR